MAAAPPATAASSTRAPSSSCLLSRHSKAAWQMRGPALPSPPLRQVQRSRHPQACHRLTAVVVASAAAGAGGTGVPPMPPSRPAFAAWPETARVALRTGMYIAALGWALLVAPAATFGLLFDASRVPAGWVRVGGVLAALFGSYYLGAALDDAEGRHPRHFYATTVVGRLALSVAFVGLVAAQQCEPALLLLAAANAASSGLLWRAARRRAAAEERMTPSVAAGVADRTA